VRIEVPGVKMDEIDISVTGDTLTIRRGADGPGGGKGRGIPVL